LLIIIDCDTPASHDLLLTGFLLVIIFGSLVNASEVHSIVCKRSQGSKQTVVSILKVRCPNSFIPTGVYHVFADGWCGLLSSCPIYKGQDVEVRCYVVYDWLSYLLQYNPIVSINASIEFLGEPGTLLSHIPIVPFPGSPPPSSSLMTTHTIKNVQAGQTISHTCRVRFDFDKSTAYTGRYRYANNPLEWSCTVREPVISKQYCIDIDIT